MRTEATARVSGVRAGTPAGSSARLGLVNDLDTLVAEWLSLPDVAERLGTDVGRVRRLVQDRFLVVVRGGEPPAPRVPAALLPYGCVLPDLPGTLTVLLDAGFEPPEALRWLLTPDDTLPGSPLEALRQGRKTEVRRRAQALAF